MLYPDGYDSLSEPTPSTIRSSTGGISPAITVQELIRIVQILEAKLGLSTFVAFTADQSTDVFTSSAHGMSNGDMLIVQSTGVLPTGLAARTRYFVVNKTANTFQLSATAGGSAINISTNGTGTHSFAVMVAIGKALVGAAEGEANYSILMPASAVVGISDVQSLSNKTLLTPTIASLINAQHDHEDAAGGGQLGISALTTVAQQSLIQTGTVLETARLVAPDGFLLCYGQAVSRTDYATLFAAIGTTYGTGDGSTTFNIPDLRGRVVAGKDDMGGTSADRLTSAGGGLDGDVLGGAGGGEIHLHPLSAAGYAQIFISAIANNALQAARRAVPSYNITHRTTNSTGQGNTSSAASGTPLAGTTDTQTQVQPTFILNKMIKT